ncbi:hypothetical protein CEXT_772251 [Caerostris extrusa]|uniref:Uncharacterized protein n=1 Tax=Caerostris extrusa TaxID=172846 RepID=A0AAV4VNJ7_CAEEX|nr:hypothetical protein CEXT_772251 [Caerostris extrusa]
MGRMLNARYMPVKIAKGKPPQPAVTRPMLLPATPHSTRHCTERTTDSKTHQPRHITSGLYSWFSTTATGMYLAFSSYLQNDIPAYIFFQSTTADIPVYIPKWSQKILDRFRVSNPVTDLTC